MTFGDWTLSWYGCGGESGGLDASIKYAGNSSLKLTGRDAGDPCYGILATHNTFSAVQMQITVWIQSEDLTKIQPRVRLSAYGNLTCPTSADASWERFRVSFWYEIVNNVKWGRVERWNGAAWIQIGTDTNFGAGAPDASSLVLNVVNAGWSLQAKSCWFDELEVYI